MEKGMIGRASNLAPTVRQNHFCMYRFFKKYILWYNFVLDFLSVPISLTPSARFLGEYPFSLHMYPLLLFPTHPHDFHISSFIPCSHFSCSRTFVQNYAHTICDKDCFLKFSFSHSRSNSLLMPSVSLIIFHLCWWYVINRVNWINNQKSGAFEDFFKHKLVAGGGWLLVWL